MSAGAARARGGGGPEIVVALDVPDSGAAERLLERLGGDARWLKIGLELFCAEGPGFARALAERGYAVMLDLKLHDIPRTVERAATRAGALGARLLTVHAAGGRDMMAAAASGARDASGAGLRVLAVTVLTSLTDEALDEIGCPGPAAELARRRARLAASSGCDGVVASPREAAALRAEAAGDFLIATPGIRPAGAAVSEDDQARAAEPRAAREAGADFLVVGRPVAGAADPRGALAALRSELAAPR